MMTKKAQAAEISQLVDEMVQKGAKMAQTEQKLRHPKNLVKRSREKVEASHGEIAHCRILWKQNVDWGIKQKCCGSVNQFNEYTI